MSLEERLDALTSAVNRNSDLLEGLTAKAKAGVESASKGKAEKPAAEEDDEKPARGRGRAKAVDKKEKAPTVAEMKKEAEAYLDVEDESEYNDRREVIRAVADFFGADKFTEIASKDRLTAVKIVRMAAAGENVDPDDIQGVVDEMEGDGGEADAKPSKRRRDDDV